MRKATLLHLLLSLALVFCATSAASGQNSQSYLNDLGSTAYGINIPVENGFINASNGNLHLEFPLASHPQRGALSLNERITYDSRIWMFSPFGTHGSYHWWPYNVPGTSTTSDGWQFIRGDEVGAVTSTTGTITSSTPCPYPMDGYNLTTTNYNIVWTDPSGTVHPFNAYLVFTENDCAFPYNPVTSQSFVAGSAADGSGYFAKDDGTGNPLITDNNGAEVYPQVIDRYGNYWSTDAQGNLIDSTGRVPVITTVNGNVTYYDVLAPNGPINNNGTRVRYTVTTASVPVATNFQQSDTYEWNPTVQYLTPVQSILLPDGSQYSFSYDGYGELSSVTLPTGGVVQYGYSNFSDSSQTSNRWLTSRTVGSNSAMTFTPSVVTSCVNYSKGCVEQVNLHKPSGDETVYQLTLNNGAWNTGVSSYTGPANSGQLLSQTTNVNTYSNGCSSPECYSGNYLSQSLATNVLFPSASQSSSQPVYSQTQSFYNLSVGKISDVKEWDFVTSSSPNTSTAPTSTPTRETLYTYTGVDPYQVKVLDSSGNQAGLTTYAYTSSATATSGITQHSTQNAGGPYLQTVSHWLNTGGSSTTTYTMYDTGQIAAVQDPNQNPTTNFAYQCQGSLPLTVTNPLGHATTYGYDCGSGAITSVKDPNDTAAGRAGTTYAYEAVAGRPYTITSPDGGVTTYTYPSSTEVDTSVLATPDPAIASADIVDSFGRPYQHTSGGISTEITYDANGRKYSVTNPHTSGSNPTDGTTYILNYDGLDRPLTQQQPDSSTLSSTYSANTVTATDERNMAWTRTVDAFGHLKSVAEPGLPSTSATTYLYDGLGNLQTITQPGVASNGESSHVRTFTYDSMARLLCASQPENSQNVCPGNATAPPPTGAMSYTYDSAGNVHSKTDARGVTTSYVYDALNRLTSKTYSDGATPKTQYVYDTSAITLGQSRFTINNVIGRLSVVCVEVPGACQSMTAYSYDAMGRTVETLNGTPSNPATGDIYAASAVYDLAGNMTSLTYPDGRVVTQGWNGAGQPQTVTYDNWNGQHVGYQYLTSASYWPSGATEALFYGNQFVSGYRLNNRLQTVATNFVSITPQGNTTYGAKVYCYGPATAPVAAGFPGCDAVASVNSGNIWQIKDFLNGANTQSFGYDSLNRIASASGPGMSQQYAIDSFGNMSLMSGGSAITHFDAANRINDLPCASSVSAYDLAGNQVCDTDANGGVRQYQYDAESRVRQIASLGSSTPFATYNYDANGNRVRKSNADGTYTEYVNFGGQTIAERQSDGSWSDYIFAGGKRIARADNYDVRIHLSGVNCSNCGSNPNMFSGTNSLTAANGYTIRPGDVLRWRQYQDGSALGGLFTYFTDGSSANGVATDQDGQLINADTTKNTWHQRTVNLSAYAGKTITVIDPFDWTTAPAGAWDIYYGDISLTSQDGSVISLYNRSMMGLNLATNPTVSNASAVTEKVPAADVLTTTEFYVSDPLGSTQMLLSSGGWPLASSQYTPFGTEISTTSNPNHYKFTGLERDQESGLDHAVFRQYASNSGRWLSPDPYNGSMNLGNPQSFNRYAYVLNNPLRYRDPSGLRPCDGSPADTDGPCSAGGGFVGFFVDLADIIGSLFHHHPQLKASRTPRPNANIKATSSYGPIQAQADGTYTMAASYSVPSLSPDYYTLSGQFGYYSPALSYVPKTKNWFFNTQGAGPKGVGVAATAGWASGDPENYLGGRGIGACYFDIVGGCGGYSPGGGGWAVEAGFGTPSWGGSLGYAVDWNSYVQSVYESIPVNEGATIPIGSGLTMQDPMYP